MRGPCKSTSTAIGSPCASAACRTSLIQPPRISGVPCEALMRTTLTPASSRAAICAAVPVAGPSVATILVRRITRYEPRLVVIKLTNSGVDDGFVKSGLVTPPTPMYRSVGSDAIRAEHVTAYRLVRYAADLAQHLDRPGVAGLGAPVHKSCAQSYTSRDDGDLPALQPSLQLLQQRHGTGDRGRREAFDGARGQAALQLSRLEQRLEPRRVRVTRTPRSSSESGVVSTSPLASSRWMNVVAAARETPRWPRHLAGAGTVGPALVHGHQALWARAPSP